MLLPGIGKAIKIDALIRDYARGGGEVQEPAGRVSRARLVWSHKPVADFEEEARKLFKAMNEARKPSLTPPEWCFKLAQRKIKSGDYDHDAGGDVLRVSRRRVMSFSSCPECGETNFYENTYSVRHFDCGFKGQWSTRTARCGGNTTSATEALYATWLHEGVHATGHKSRLDRNFTGRFGTQERSAEELVAELGSAFLCADLAVTPHLRDDHAHYIAHWLEIMKGDKKAIFTAAAAANRAVEWLHGKQPEQD